MRVWAKTKEFFEGKFLVIRRDGSIPAWPHFVMGARDPAVPAALKAYAEHGKACGYDQEYLDSILELANDFEKYRLREGNGDADAAPHRKDNPEVIKAMQGSDATILVWQSTNEKKTK